MAFKIQSIENMKGIATKMSDCANSAQETTNIVISSIDEMLGSISGKGVDQTLNKLRNAVTAETQTMIQLLNDISSFITSQTTSYTVNEETVSSTLTSVQSALDSITL